jgi:hypothetical protein
MYANRKISLIESIPRKGGREKMMDGVNSTMIYCQKF